MRLEIAPSGVLRSRPMVERRGGVDEVMTVAPSG